MTRVLIVVDMQNDFINGSLGTEEAVQIIPQVIREIEEGHYNQIFATMDTHQINYLNTYEGKNLPVEHCIKGTNGWEIADGIYAAGCEIIDKPSFGYTGWDRYEFEDVCLIGLCTDICVVSNALIIKALYPEIRVAVDVRCTAGVTPESKAAAFETMKMCQIELIGEE